MSIAFFPDYLPKINFELDRYLYVDTKKMHNNADPWERNSAEKELYPFYMPQGGPLNYFVDVSFMRLLEKKRESFISNWGLLDGYNVITPGNYETIRLPPPYYIVFNIWIRAQIPSSSILIYLWW